MDEMNSSRFDHLRQTLGLSVAEAFGWLALFWHRTREAGMEALPLGEGPRYLPALPNVDTARLLGVLTDAGYLAAHSPEAMRIVDNAGCAAAKERRQAKGRLARAAVGQTKKKRAQPPKPKALQVVPSGAPTPAQAANKATWEAYAAAYARKIRQPPVRNAKTNALIAQFVQRIGATEAPHVIAFFVEHPNALYMQRLYQLELAVRDAEGLRTQWANGRAITASEVQAYDRDYQYELTRQRIEAGQI